MAGSFTCPAQLLTILVRLRLLELLGIPFVVTEPSEASWDVRRPLVPLVPPQHRTTIGSNLARRRRLQIRWQRGRDIWGLALVAATRGCLGLCDGPRSGILGATLPLGVVLIIDGVIDDDGLVRGLAPLVGCGGGVGSASRGGALGGSSGGLALFAAGGHLSTRHDDEILGQKAVNSRSRANFSVM